jgi:putative acetyltransferase
MKDEIKIRGEQERDVEVIRRVHETAFGREAEAQIVDALRANGRLVLSLVAEVEGAVVAHVALSPATVQLPTRVVETLALGPVAVLPGFQRRGIGAGLIQESFDECRKLGHTLIFLLGHPSYYPRLGFGPAKPLGVRWSGDAGDGVCEPFMVKELSDGALLDQLQGQHGVFTFGKEFDER